MKYFKKAFTMIELVFVIVIMGILAKFGVGFLSQAYKSFISSKIDSELHSGSQLALDIVSARMAYRIPNSTIAREDNGTTTPAITYTAGTASIYEWIGYDIDGYRGDSNGTWSGVIDLNESLTNKTQLYSLITDTSKISSMIQALSYGYSDVNCSAIYFRDSSLIPGAEDNPIFWGWDISDSPSQGKAIFNTQKDVYIHPITYDTNTSLFRPYNLAHNFDGVKASENYQFAWTAYAITLEDYDEESASNLDGTNTGNLTLWYDYQPWLGEDYNSSTTKRAIIMENVSDFKLLGNGGTINIKVCVKSLLLKGEENAKCKDKTIY